MPVETELNLGRLSEELTGFKAVYNKYFSYIENPDDIIAKKAFGKPISQFYDSMIDKDGHLSSLIKTRKRSVVKLAWEIVPYVERGADVATERDQHIADEMYYIISKMKNLKRSIKAVLSAMEHGYSVSEIVYDFDPDSSYIYARGLKHRRPELFRFGDEDVLEYSENGLSWQEMPRHKFVVYSFDMKYENLYGNSLLRSVYWPHWFKTNIVKYLMTFMERLGNPMIYGKFPPGLTDDKIDALLAHIKSIQSNSYGVFPDNVNLDVLEAKFRKEADFRNIIEYFDDEESKIIIGQTLTSGEGRRSGSLALGQVHENVKDEVTASDVDEVNYLLTEQLIVPLVQLNFGTDTPPPLFRLIHRHSRDIAKDAETYERLAKAGLPIGINYIYNATGIPAPAEGEDILKAAPESSSPFPPIGFNKKQFKTAEPPVKETLFYDAKIASTYYDKMAFFMDDVMAAIEKDVLLKLQSGGSVYGLIDQAIRLHMEQEFKGKLSLMSAEAVFEIGKDFAQRYAQPLSEQALHAIKDKYIQERFYTKGTIDGIANTFKRQLSNVIPNWADKNINFDVNQMKAELQKTFTNMKRWKAHQIAQTEVVEAANHAVFQTMDATGLSAKVEAWFNTDAMSCPICQDWGANSPYDYNTAKSMGSPHIACDCAQWTFTLKEI